MRDPDELMSRSQFRLEFMRDQLQADEARLRVLQKQLQSVEGFANPSAKIDAAEGRMEEVGKRSNPPDLDAVGELYRREQEAQMRAFREGMRGSSRSGKTVQQPAGVPDQCVPIGVNAGIQFVLAAKASRHRLNMIRERLADITSKLGLAHQPGGTMPATQIRNGTDDESLVSVLAGLDEVSDHIDRQVLNILDSLNT